MAMAMESTLEIAVGIGVEVFILLIVLAVLYRFFAGRFLIPKREGVLPNQLAILVHGEEQVKVVGPGSHWIRPGRKLILCDARPRSLHIEGMELISKDGGVLRLNVSGEYAISDAMAYFRANTQTADAFYFAIRRELQEKARTMTSDALTSPGGASLFAKQVEEGMKTRSAEFGMQLNMLELWGVYQSGWVTIAEPPASSGMIH
jgi:regulator of protease activity HflC (stomatin/prohibitin superfamily)